MLIDATYGRKTAAVLVMDSDHVVLSALPAEKLGPRLGPVGGGFHAGGDLILEKQGKIFILSGPSGSGKGTVLKSATEGASGHVSVCVRHHPRTPPG